MPETLKVFDEYFKKVCDAYRLNNIETAYNAPIIELINQFGCEARDLSGGRARAAGENIDILLWREGENTNETEPFAGIEVKRVDGIDDRAREQVLAETRHYGNVILTDNLTWHFWSLTDGEPARYSAVSLIENDGGVLKLNNQNAALLATLINDFLLKAPAQLKSSVKLAEYMAIHARTIRSVIKMILKEDDAGQPNIDDRQKRLPMFNEIYALYIKIKENLRPYLDTGSFADMYAQTIVYGLFIARYNVASPEAFNRYEAIGNLRRESALLKLFFSHIAVSDNQHPTLEAVIDKLCALYRIADVEMLLDKDEEKDTIIHFYEEFLKYYDPELRKSLGVFYTPYQVVRYMVRMVDEILIDEFGIEGGLSNNDVYDMELPSTPYLQGKKEANAVGVAVPRVSILDPACGTGTFHAEIIKYVKEKYFSGGKEPFWKDYILDEEKSLMSRLIGFEILMPSYVVAHLKIRRTIHETLGSSVANNDLPQSNIYLTNTLAPPQTLLEDSPQTSLFTINDFSGAVTEEARQADKWKSRRPIKVIIGNPPYLAASTTPFDISAYKKEPDGITKLKERNPKWLNDDYVKFIRWSEKTIAKNNDGVLAFITPHGYLDNPTFRGMRASLLRSFNKLIVLDLHGNVKKKEKAPDGAKDENIFDIQQGVSILIGIKTNNEEDWGIVKSADLLGSRAFKLNQLLGGDISFSSLVPQKKTALLETSQSIGETEYAAGVGLAELFSVNSVGIVTGNDGILIGGEKGRLYSKINAFSLEGKGKIHERLTRSDLNETNLRSIAYRLFDERYIYYDTSVVERPRKNISQHFYYDKGDRPANIGMVFTNSTTQSLPWDGLFVADTMIDGHFIDYPSNGIGYVAPLYLRPEILDPEWRSDSKGTELTRPPLYLRPEGLDPEWRTASKETELNRPPLHLRPEGVEPEWKTNFDEQELSRLIGNLSARPEPIQVFDYIYGILYDPNYREKYNELLKRDYPRVPVVADPEAMDNPDAFYVSEERFWQYVDAGSRLRKLHLLQEKRPVELALEPNDSDNLEIGAIKYKDGALSLNKNKSILGIPEEVWGYFIGGYQVLPKWFKSHKGELLDYQNFMHIENVVGALAETIKIQKELA